MNNAVLPSNMRLVKTKTTSKHLLKGTTLLATLACLAFPQLSLAQESTDSSTPTVISQIDEIVVTARKREESLQRTPISVTALTDEDLELRNIEGLEALQYVVPGFSAIAGPSGGSDGQYFLRGIGQSDWIAAFEPGVGTYVDGVYLGRVTGAALDLVDVNRIEVLRGPQGTLFGRNTIGGAVSIVSKEPSFEHEAHMEMTVGERDLLAGKAVVSGPVIGEKVAFRLSLNARTQDGYGRRLVDGKRNGDREVIAGRAAVKWIVSQKLTANFAADLTLQTGTAAHATALVISQFLYPNTSQYIVDDPYTTWSGLLPPDDKDTWGLSLTLDYELAEKVSLKSITAYRSLDALSGLDFDATPMALLEQHILDTRQDQFSQEIQLAGNSLDGRLNWLLGFYYFDEDIEQYFETKIDFPGFKVLNPQLNIHDNKSVAGFAQASYSITNALSITAGVRYTHEKKSQFYDHYFIHLAGSFLPEGTIQPIVLPVEVSEDWNSTTPKFGLEYQINDETMAYASYSEGFRSGGFNGRPASVNAITSFDPEKVKVWELGLKSDLLDNRLRFNASAFLNNYSDLQLGTTASINNAPALIVGNAGKSKLKGAEVEITAVPAEGLVLNVGVAYLDQKFTHLDPGVLTAGGLTLESDQPNTPKWQILAGLQYTRFLQNSGSITGRVDFSNKSRRSFFFSTPREFQNDETVVNARLTYQTPDQKWKVSAYALNLFDERYNAFMEDAEAVFGVALIWPAPPQEFGFSVGYSF